MLGITAILSLAWMFAASHAGMIVPLTFQMKQLFVDKHNVVRAATGAYLPNVKWDWKLERVAQQWASQCMYGHSNNQYGFYGENIYASWPLDSRNYGRLILKALDSWASEVSVYRAQGSWACVTGYPTCGHYSQMVWRNTRSIGCAIAHCQNLPNYVVCEYEPAGNWIGDSPY